MTKHRHSISLDDPNGLRLEALWSRSGTTLLCTVWRIDPKQLQLQMAFRPDQIEELVEFFAETLAKSPADRHVP